LEARLHVGDAHDRLARERLAGHIVPEHFEVGGRRVADEQAVAMRAAARAAGRRIGHRFVATGTGAGFHAFGFNAKPPRRKEFFEPVVFHGGDRPFAGQANCCNAPCASSSACRTLPQAKLDTALRLGRYFKMSTQFWLNLQSHHELEIVEEQLVLARFLPPCRSKIIVRACHFFGRWTRNRQNHKINQLPELTYENKTLVIRAIVDCVTGFAGACRQSGSGNHRCLQDAL
jgi:hypothetical protein